MKMTQESLVAAGYTQEQSTAILDAHKSALEGRYVPKARFDEVNEKLTTAETDLGKAKQELKTKENQDAVITTLKTQVKTLTEEKGRIAEETKTALAEERKKDAMKNALQGKVHDVDYVLNNIDTAAVKFEDGKLSKDFEEMVKTFTDEKPFLVISEEGAGFKFVGETPPDGQGEKLIDSNTPEAMAKRLAQGKNQATTAAQKASEHYFKGGNT